MRSFQLSLQGDTDITSVGYAANVDRVGHLRPALTPKRRQLTAWIQPVGGRGRPRCRR